MTPKNDPESEIRNPKSEIEESKIQNPKPKIKFALIETHKQTKIKRKKF
jgi:hypothetical protein